MLCYPLSAVEAQIHLKRLKSEHTQIVGSGNHFFIKETRVVKCAKNGLEAEVIIMHGRSLGRHTHSKADRRIIPKKTHKPQPRIIA